MRLEEGNMSGPVTGTKAVFPLQLPGQPLLFPSSMGTNLCGRDRSSICNIKHKVCPAHCLCGSTPTGPHPPPGPYNRLLLPMTSRHEPSLLPPRLEGRLPDSWLLSSPTTRNANYESLLINGIPSSYRKFNSPDGYHSLDYALLASARRKNATRETTSTLKQWLNEHRKNPYPTKGEKVMLAILTKMTLTQVSTWFANARRRLKKENKMTWSPRKKSNERKNNPDSASLSSLSDQEAMDVDIVNAVSKLDEKSVSNRADSGIEHSNSSSPFIFDIESQRTSVIRSVESPTFDEIKSRFKSEPSPVNHLQKWVDGCFEAPHEEEDNGYGKDMTPPSTPIEQQVTTFTSQKLFEAFDAAKIKDNPTSYSRSDSYTSEPIGLIFSSKQPVCSTKEVEINTDNKSIDFPFLYNTPQPSPTDKLYTGDSITKKMPEITKSTPESTEPIASEENKDVKDTKNETKPTEYRAQGLTTSRELEAVLALTALCKT